MRWASSAAHVAGRRLVSAEAATWLGEHFRSSLADVREAVDDFYLAGINHVVYHGTSYTPPGEPWPGWPFYASVHFDPYNPWWQDFAALNRHVTRAQSFLQQGEPGNDVLLYYPLYDSLAVRGTGLLTHFGGERPGPDGSGFDAAARRMLERGYAFDFISDRQLSAVHVAGGELRTSGGSRYRTILLPPCRFIPLGTFEALTALARAGATIAVLGRGPEDVAGLGDLEARRARYRSLQGALGFEGAPGVVSEARIGSGAFLRFEDLETLLARAGVRREAMVDRGVRFSRRRLGGGWCYFVAHRGEQPFDGWLATLPAGGVGRAVRPDGRPARAGAHARAHGRGDGGPPAARAGRVAAPRDERRAGHRRDVGGVRAGRAAERGRRHLERRLRRRRPGTPGRHRDRQRSAPGRASPARPRRPSPGPRATRSCSHGPRRARTPGSSISAGSPTAHACGSTVGTWAC